MLFVFLPNFFFVTCCNFHKFVVDITKQFLALKRVIYVHIKCVLVRCSCLQFSVFVFHFVAGSKSLKDCLLAQLPA